MKQAGIWLDYKEAFIIQLNKDKTTTQHILSEIEDFHVVGGSRSKTVYGPVDAVSERKYLERKKHQTTDYFNRIMKAIAKVELLYVFGPAEAKIGLQKLIDNTKNSTVQLLAVETAKKITAKQRVARVKDFFNYKTCLS